MSERVDTGRYIVVEGLLGSGKGALAKALSRDLNARLVQDAGAENPFREDWYRDPKAFAFSSQIFTLLNRVRQQSELAQGDLFTRAMVSDYLFERDRIWAYLTLSDAELPMYEQLYKLLTRDPMPSPDLVVYLQASPELLATRLKANGLLRERGMNLELLESMSQAYQQFFFNYKESALLIVNTNDINLYADGEDVTDLIRRIHETRGGTQVYTPKK